MVALFVNDFALLCIRVMFIKEDMFLLLLSILNLVIPAGWATVPLEPYPAIQFTVEDSITIKDYSKARITLLSVGQERTLVCESPISVSANKRKNLQIDWYFGDTDSLTKIIFDSNGWSLSHRTTTNNSSSSAFRILLDDGVYRNRGSIVVKSSNISSFSDKNGLSYNNLLNGILACVYSRSGDISSIFHLMTLLPPLPINRESAAVTQCPPGHAAASYAGLSVCQPCLPNEFSPGGVSPCQPCRAGQFNSRFASPECAKQRLKRSTTAGKATVHLMHRRLPLADFRSVIMYHCLLILLLSAVVVALLLVSALSFETVWHGVLSGIEMSIAGALDDRFVLKEPEADGNNDTQEA